VPVAASRPGTEIEVDVRGKARAAEVREKPLYAPPRKRGLRDGV
jgi:glycine cleavage system aminomethyltransferase T